MTVVQIMKARTRTFRTGLFVAVAALGLVTAACGSGNDPTAEPVAAASAAASDDHGHDASESTAATELRHDMRKLWEDHVTWTRQFVVSAVAGLPDTDAAAGRLLQNQADIGDAIGTYYGDGAGDQLTELLRGHIFVAADLVAAAKAGDGAALQQHRDAWYVNANEIAAFLADANPAWPRATLEQMMRTHLDDTIAEATARLTGDWAADIAAYDRIHTHILGMADALAAGIVEQFPDRFDD